MMQLKITEFLPVGLLALGPLMLMIDSAFVGFCVGLLLTGIISLNLILILPSRNLFPVSLRLLAVLILNSALAISMSDLLLAHAYPFAVHLGLFLPLLAINSLVLSYAERLFTSPDFKTAVSTASLISVLISVMLTLYGAMRELLVEFSLLGDLDLFTDIAFDGVQIFNAASGLPVFATTAGSLFLISLLFAAFNLFTNKSDSTMTGTS